MKLNEKILYYRKAVRLSQEELAARIGVSRQAVSKWELGESTPEVDKLLSLARTFGVTTDELLSEDEPPHAQEDAPPESTGAAPAPEQDDLDRAVGVLRQLARRYRRWLGAGIALMGALILAVSGRRWYIAQDELNRYLASLGPNSNVFEYVDEMGQTVIEPLVIRSPEADSAAVTMLLGAIILVVGAVWARQLYRKQSFGQKDG